MDKLRGEFIDIIQWLDPTNNTKDLTMGKIK